MAKRKPSETVRVGIIGAGIGRAHLQGYSKVPNAEVVALCDVDEARARAMAASMKVEGVQFFSDHRAMLEEAGIDAVSVGVPNVLHRPIAVDCLQAGKHVLCEKPLSINAREGQKIADAAAKYKVKCMVGQVNRFRGDSQFLKGAIANGDLGRIYYAHTGWLRKRGIPGYGGWFTTKAMSGGGPLIDIGVHLLDIAWWLSGCPNPVSVTGVTYAEFGPRGKGLGGWAKANPKGTFDVEDLAVAIIRFDNGQTINLEVSWAINNASERQWCQLYGTEGGCEWGEKAGIFTEMHGLTANSHIDLPQLDPWQGETQHFVDSIINDTIPDPDATQGVTMMNMLDAIYKSAETKREVIIK